MTTHAHREVARMRRARVVAATALILATAALALAPPAHAGTYTVLGCRDRNDAPAPTSDADGGWRAATSAIAGGLRSGNTCASAGQLYSDIGGPDDFGTSPVFSGWTFEAPAGTSVAGYLLDWEGWGRTSGAVGDLLISGDQPGSFEQYDHPGTVARRVSTRSGMDDSKVSIIARCTAVTQHCGLTYDGGDAWLSLYRTEVQLRDSSAPSASAPSGGPVARSTWKATETITFNATDAGGGVHAAVIRVDGREVVRQGLADGRCVEAAPGVYLVPHPCPGSVSPDVGLDTTLLAEGDHEIRLLVEDAAGNATTVYGPTTKTIDNIPAPTNTQAPSVSGYAESGEQLLAHTGSWDAHGATDLSFAYQWQRCAADGSACVDVAGANSSARTLTAGDVGSRLRVVVTGRTSQGVTSATRDASPAVRDRATNLVVATPSTARDLSAETGESGRATPDTRGAANGENPSDRAAITASFSRNHAGALTTRFGERAVVRGKLVDAGGAGIRNAKVELVATNAVPGATAVDKGGARTRADGSWTLILPADVASRTLTFRYRSHLADERPVAEVELRLRVRAGVSLHVTPRRTRNRGTIRFSGRLLGRPVPRRGKVIELQARGRGAHRWITFKTLRTSSSGAFRARYTFHATYGAVTYEFRARAREDSSYPYLTGASKRVLVRVG